MRRAGGAYAVATALLVGSFWNTGALAHEAERGAPEEKRPLFIVASAGLGLSDSSENRSVRGSGLWLGAEVGIDRLSWFSPRAYVNFVTTNTNRERCGEGELTWPTDCESKSRLLSLGLKARITAPIPYVAPYLELGLGTSAGAMTTRTPLATDKLLGVTYHVPLTVGISLGEFRTVDFEFAYFFLPSNYAVVGAAPVKFGFPWP